jgi:hypothetical protein
MLERVQRLATAAWLAVLCGGGLGFLAREVLEAGQPAVGLAWAGGAALGAAPALRSGGRGSPREDRRGSGDSPPASLGSEDGQSTVEWTALVLFASLALGALAAFGPHVDGRSFGGFLAHRLVCAVKGGCSDGDAALARAYGEHEAALVRAHAPNLLYEPGERQIPVDWRRCRKRDCANARDERDLDVHRSDRGERATVFTRVLRKHGRTYIQYWLYYPDSNTAWAGSDKVWEAAWLLPKLAGVVDRAPRYPGFHRDDWEGFVVRLDPDGSAWARASSHGHWQGCKWKACHGRWLRHSGWTRVSRGSHAGHIPVRSEADHAPLVPGRDLDERMTTGEGLRLIPLEGLDRSRYRPNHEDVEPPWRKDVYRAPESEGS